MAEEHRVLSDWSKDDDITARKSRCVAEICSTAPDLFSRLTRACEKKVIGLDRQSRIGHGGRNM